MSPIKSDYVNLVKYNAGFNAKNIEGCLLILPSVSVGNVGQLAVDLLLENINPSPICVGAVIHHAFEPIIANGKQNRQEFVQQDHLMTPCELFYCEEKKIVLLQFHSPISKRKEDEFIEFITDWIRSKNFREVLCIGSSLASLRKDVQLQNGLTRYLPGKYLQEDVLSKIIKEGIKEWETNIIPKVTEENSLKTTNSSSIEDFKELRIPGGGIISKLTNECNQKKIPVLSLIIFASDGVNIPESQVLLDLTDRIYNVLPRSTNPPAGNKSNSDKLSNIKIPDAWKYLVTGYIEPREIF